MPALNYTLIYQMTKKQPKSEKSDVKHPEQPVFDTKLLLTEQKRLQTICKEAEKKGSLEVFSKVKYKQTIYQSGEFLHLYDPTNTIPYVARLQSIMKVPEEKDINAILQVQWLLRKQDLPKVYADLLSSLSVAELFPSGQSHYVFIESVMRKCHVISYTEYQFLRNAGDTIHFSRAVLDPATGELSPPPSEWVKECYCQTLVNPDRVYVQCDKCSMWIHNECVEDEEELEEEIFVCRKCK